MADKTIDDYQFAIENAIGIGTVESLRDALRMCRSLEKHEMYTVSGGRESDHMVFDEGSFDLAHALNKQIRSAVNALVRRGGGADALKLYYDTQLFDAPYDFDSFCIYIEKDREPEKKFYLPRRKQLLPLAQALQDLEDRKIYLLGISLPPGVGKTTLAEFFLAWTCGKHPELPNLIGSHSYPFVDGMYSEMLRIFDPMGEYRWNDVFPGVHVLKTSVRTRMIDLGGTKKDGKRFATLEFGTLGASLAGRVRAMNLLYCDDLVDSMETALSRDRLDKMWMQYYGDLRQRKIGDWCAELHIATRWSVHDCLGRLIEEYDGDETARFISVPAMDENDESNFDYPYGLGYTTAKLREQREIMDEVSWKALFMNEPIERDGTLFSPEELQYFDELPDEEPDSIIAVCDTKEQGSDYCTMPVLYQYGNRFYVNSWICDNGKVEVVQERIAERLVHEKVKLCQIESNRGGTLFAATVSKRVAELGGFTKITTKWTQTNKETRIQVNSAYVKDRFYFRDPKSKGVDKEYRLAMDQLYSYSMVGKVKHDDVADVLSLSVNFILSFAGNVVSIIKRRF